MGLPVRTTGGLGFQADLEPEQRAQFLMILKVMIVLTATYAFATTTRHDVHYSVIMMAFTITLLVLSALWLIFGHIRGYLRSE